MLWAAADNNVGKGQYLVSLFFQERGKACTPDRLCCRGSDDAAERLLPHIQPRRPGLVLAMVLISRCRGGERSAELALMVIAGVSQNELSAVRAPMKTHRE